jgi:phosphatidylglycerophosphatase A
MSDPLYLAVTIGFTLLAVWIHDVGDAILGEKDSRKLVWDELVGFLVACALLPTLTWRLLARAFVVERLIDIVKVPPANWVERRWPGGWGVVGDDVVAGLYTRGVLHVAMALVPALTG